MALKFDMQGLGNEILQKLSEQLSFACEAWEQDAYKYFRGFKYVYENTNLKAEVETQIVKQTNMLITYFRANTIALADSYGTGSLMLDDNPGLADYMRDKSRWNPERKGKTIVGRRAGTYTDIFGQVHKTSGVFKGKPLENRRGITGTKYFISPTSPSRAIQIADKWFYEKYLPRAYQLAVKSINFSKFLKES